MVCFDLPKAKEFDGTSSYTGVNPANGIVIYYNINKEDANKYRGLLSLNQSIYTANCEPNTVIMHPLPRDSRSDANELDRDLYENPNLAIFRQADNGVVIRMAIFALVLGVENKILETAKSVNWKVGLSN